MRRFNSTSTIVEITCGDCENFRSAPTSKYGICILLGIYISEDSPKPLTCPLFRRREGD